MKKIIIIGATSGIGKELAKVFSLNGYEVGITGRRTNLLEELASELPTKTYISTIDVKNAESAIRSLDKLIKEMNGMDILVINAGIAHTNASLDWIPEKETIDTNVSGFTAMAGAGMRYFIKNGSGHLVGISSIARIRGSDTAPAYSASKAFVSNYLEGLGRKVTKEKLPIAITDIQPGFVDTAIIKSKKVFWMASPEKAAKQIYNAIDRKRRAAYITKRWILIAWLLKILPGYLYRKI
ncbi:MAG: SDR family NAD(P)-dependent oxidoreductase [Candidatus Omnitrophota bacterium]|nr:MAG: SDR family NAD(P)-dependent oxidoreductase [Candidatus Omnitrophota bacterium]